MCEFNFLNVGKIHFFVTHDVISPNISRRREFGLFNFWKMQLFSSKLRILIDFSTDLNDFRNYLKNYLNNS